MVLARLRSPAVHASAQGGMEYSEARLSPRMPGFFFIWCLWWVAKQKQKAPLAGGAELSVWTALIRGQRYV